jgi:hypothetical protein
MSQNNYGYCNYCGRYRPLKYHGGYCSEQCYCESGQQEQDIIKQEKLKELLFERNDLGAFIQRTIRMFACWVILYIIMAHVFGPNNIAGLAKLILSIPYPYNLIFLGIISLVQNILMQGKGKNFRIFIIYGIPIILIIAVLVTSTTL